MISGVDGRLNIERLTPLAKDAPENYSTTLYLHKNQAENADAWIVGRNSVQELAFPNVLDFSNEPATQNFNTYVADRKTNKGVVIFDSRGITDYTCNTIMDDEIIIVLGQTVSDKYLDLLKERNISYLFAGKDGYDLNVALDILSKDFGFDTFTLVGGATINGAFLKAGLIDELLLQLYPGIDGLSGVSSIFETKGLKDYKPALGQSLELVDVQKEEFGILYLRYKFHKN
ncbi:5-amino-6-(5-phosphoribosylamino)uracil reductase [Chishuiella changwenlii]|uniref:2-hydroxy-3-oxopropionate reductase n=2 Tax=Chishuiella changwenlii TaxID=1434701 RepID=A0A1M7AH33_9FLAO|nr:2-hydroxy-3-oxopropionate reductase [Chishuiella changwenlii]SHL41925.1 5-amino-6-(5-phosphoribosylamino)uracil reductase [Chishuiella changwenlii]